MKPVSISAARRAEVMSAGIRELKLARREAIGLMPYGLINTLIREMRRECLTYMPRHMMALHVCVYRAELRRRFVWAGYPPH